MSNFEEILKRASSDPQAQQEFFQKFLNGQVYLPTQDFPGLEKGSQREIKEGESFSPLVFEQEGQVYLPVFDEVEKLQAWTDQDLTFIQVPTYTILPNIDANLRLVLNPNSEYGKTFTPEEIELLNQAIDQSNQVVYEIPPNAQFTVDKIESLPPGLEEALENAMAKHPEVEAAYLAEVMIEGKHKGPTILLVISLDEDKIEEEILRALHLSVSEALEGTLPEDVPMDMSIYNREGGLSKKVVERVEAFYKRD